MLIRFKGEHAGSFIMFGDIAKQLLRMMGSSGNDEGALRAEDIAVALAQLEQALKPYQSSDDNQTSDNDDESDDYDDAEPSVGLATRAIPLLELLQEEVKQNGYIMWQVER